MALIQQQSQQFSSEKLQSCADDFRGLNDYEPALDKGVQSFQEHRPTLQFKAIFTKDDRKVVIPQQRLRALTGKSFPTSNFEDRDEPKATHTIQYDLISTRILDKADTKAWDVKDDSGISNNNHNRDGTKPLDNDATRNCAPSKQDINRKMVLMEQLQKLSNEKAKNTTEMLRVEDVRKVKLCYYSETLSTESGSTFDSFRKQNLRTIEYLPQSLDPLEVEAAKHRLAWGRWYSFSNEASKWKRSLSLAYLLSQLGFYFAPEDAQPPSCDKIRCAFCKRGKFNWWSYEYPETAATMSKRPSDFEIASGFQRWHAAKSANCPRVLGLSVGSIEFTVKQKALVNEKIMEFNIKHEIVKVSGIIGVCPAPKFQYSLICTEDEKIDDESSIDRVANLIAEAAYEPAACFNPTESEWVSMTTSSNPSNLRSSKLIKRATSLIDALDPNSFKYKLFVCESRRYETFLQSSQNDMKELYKESGLLHGSYVWPVGVQPLPKKLAAAGFFTTRENNSVICFCCGLKLTNLSENCEPWIEHAVKNPDCGFVRYRKGHQFIKTARLNVSNYDYNPLTEFSSPLSYRYDPRDLRARPELPLMRKICEDCNISPKILKQGIETLFKSSNKPIVVIALLEIINNIRSRMAELKIDSEDEFIAAVNAGCIPNRDHTGETSKDDARRSEDRLVCKVCRDNSCGIVFQCGHLACTTCASKVVNCPICRQFIVKRMRVYY